MVPGSFLQNFSVLYTFSSNFYSLLIVGFCHLGLPSLVSTHHVDGSKDGHLSTVVSLPLGFVSGSLTTLSRLVRSSDPPVLSVFLMTAYWSLLSSRLSTCDSLSLFCEVWSTVKGSSEADSWLVVHVYVFEGFRSLSWWPVFVHLNSDLLCVSRSYQTEGCSVSPLRSVMCSWVHESSRDGVIPPF